MIWTQNPKGYCSVSYGESYISQTHYKTPVIFSTTTQESFQKKNEKNKRVYMRNYTKSKINTI